MVAEYLQLSRSDLHRLRDIQTPFAAAHHFALCDFRLNLELACEEAAMELSEWVPERVLRTPPVVKVPDPRPPKGSPSSLIPLIPDGEFLLTLRDSRSQSFRVEIDLATISRKRLAQRLRGYLAHAKKDDRPVLWIVPDAARKQAIVEWASAEAREIGADPTLFWITQASLISEDSVLGPIWQVIGGPTMALDPHPVYSSSPTLRPREELQWRV